MNSLSDHNGPVSVIATSPTLGDIATVSASAKKHNSKNLLQLDLLRTSHTCNPPPLLIPGSAGACNLQVWTINGSCVKKILVEEEIQSLAYSAAPEGVYVNILAGGLANGNIK